MSVPKLKLSDREPRLALRTPPIGKVESERGWILYDWWLKSYVLHNLEEPVEYLEVEVHAPDGRYIRLKLIDVEPSHPDVRLMAGNLGITPFVLASFIVTAPGNI